MKKNEYFLKMEDAVKMGYSSDKRKRRRQHRKQSKTLLINQGGFFNNFASPGSTVWWISQWHKEQARMI